MADNVRYASHLPLENSISRVKNNQVEWPKKLGILTWISLV